MPKYRLRPLVDPDDYDLEDVEEVIVHDGHHLDGDAPYADNISRAAFALTAVVAFNEATSGGSSEPVDTVIGDLLCDLMHLCDAIGQDFGTLVDHARYHYEPETRGEL